MIANLAVFLSFQLAGEVITRGAGLPLPGPVLGLALLQGHGAAGLLVGLGMAHLIRGRAELGDGPPLRP